MAKKKEEIKDEFSAAVSHEVLKEPIEIKTTCTKVDELNIVFNSEDLNKVVEKINEIIKKTNGC